MQTVKNLVYKNENPYPFHASIEALTKGYWRIGLRIAKTKTSFPVAQLLSGPAN